MSADGSADAVQPRLSLASDVDTFMRRPVLDRFRALITADSFPARFRAEPLVFEATDPVFGFACSVPDCAAMLARACRYCTTHESERKAARKAGVSEPDWLATAEPLTAQPVRSAITAQPQSCRICPDRDEFDLATGLCKTHYGTLRKARLAAEADGKTLDVKAWTDRQTALPGRGPCLVANCPRRSPTDANRGLCEAHWRSCRPALTAARARGADDAKAFAAWLVEAGQSFNQGVVSLRGLPPLAEAEIRYALNAHAQQDRAAQCFPAWLRSLVQGVRAAGVESITELDLTTDWAAQQDHVDRVVKGMLAKVAVIHASRKETRDLGYIDPVYWGFRFPNRRSPFDLTDVTQPWLRDIVWDYLAAMFDDPKHPRSSGPVENLRRAAVTLSAFLADHCADGGKDPSQLTEDDARAFIADLYRRCSQGLPPLGLYQQSGEPTAPLSAVSRALVINNAKRILRSALDTGAVEELALSRRFIAAIPSGGSVTTRRPRPLSDEVYAQLTDPANTAWLAEHDPSDVGLEDIWFIQARCGRRISEVVNLRYDCITTHSGRTWVWFDMTKVGLLDYAVQAPKDVHDVIQARQAKTSERFRLAMGRMPSGKERGAIALFASATLNPGFTNAITTATFSAAFHGWMRHLDLEGIVPHQARHTLATRLQEAGASPAVIREILGHISEAMQDSYKLISKDAATPFLQKVWVRGPGAAKPGEVVLTPDDSLTTRAQDRLLDITALPTEGGLCTFRPVVGGSDCPFGRDCGNCEHHVLTGADYSYWKRQQQRWAVLAEGAPDDATREYIYAHYRRSNEAIEGLGRALASVGLLEQAEQIDLRTPAQDFFNPLWSQGWRANELVALQGESVNLDTNTTDFDPLDEAVS